MGEELMLGELLDNIRIMKRDLIEKGDVFQSCNSAEECKSLYINILNNIENLEHGLFVTNQMYLLRSILELCSRLKYNIDNSELIRKISANSSNKSKYHGIQSGERIVIILTGGFSAGKTTFLKRLLHKTIGSISPYPETATIVKHTGGSAGNFHITFEEYDAGDNNAEFRKLLREFKLESKFYPKGNIWTQEQEISELWDATKIIEFINKSSRFPGAVKQLDWQHPVNKKEALTDILQYVTLIDMPGIEGKEEHTIILNQYFQDNTPDVILHVIDTERFVPGDDEFSFIYEKMTELSDSTMKFPLFIWIYQKKLTDETYSEHGNNSLKDAIEKFIERKRPTFQDKDKIDGITKILLSAPQINAMGNNEDYDVAEQAIVEIIGLYFYITGTEYVRAQKAHFEETPMPEAIIAGNKPGEYYKINDPIEYILESINQFEPTLKTIGEAKVTLEDLVESAYFTTAVLLLDYYNEHKGGKAGLFGESNEKKLMRHKQNIKNILESQPQKYETVIKKYLNEILGYSESDRSFVLKGQKNKLIKRLVEEISNEGKHDEIRGIERCVKPDLDFWLGGGLRNYFNRPDVVELVYNIQAITLLEAYHSNILGKFYIRIFESSFIDNLRADLDGIQKNLSMFEDIDVNTIENILISRTL
jgi:hypothetical protein